MAIIVKKDVGFGVPLEQAYVTFDISWWRETPTIRKPSSWDVSVKVYLNKEARQHAILKQWVKTRCRDVQAPVPMDDSIAATLGIPSIKHWNNHFMQGPWVSIEDQLWIEKHILDVEAHPVQTFSRSFKPEELPELTTIGSALPELYKLAVNPKSPAWVLINSRSLDNKEILDSIHHDLDTPQKVIQQAGTKHPVLLERRYHEFLIRHGVNLVD